VNAVAEIEMVTRNGDRITITTNDPEKIRQLENAPFDDSSNISISRVTED
jgi:hypothetical protein